MDHTDILSDQTKGTTAGDNYLAVTPTLGEPKKLTLLLLRVKHIIVSPAQLRNELHTRFIALLQLTEHFICTLELQ